MQGPILVGDKLKFLVKMWTCSEYAVGFGFTMITFIAFCRDDEENLHTIDC